MHRQSSQIPFSFVPVLGFGIDVGFEQSKIVFIIFGKIALDNTKTPLWRRSLGNISTEKRLKF